MGTMKSENALLREENESKPSLLNAYYKDVFENSTNTRNMLDLNDILPSEIATEGALVLLATMDSRPVEFKNASKTIDLFTARPATRFLDQVPTLESIGLSLTNIEHSFFIECYMKYPTKPSVCENGILDNTSPVITLPPEGEIPPRASILKCTPKRFRKTFQVAQKASQTVSEVSNASLSLSVGHWPVQRAVYQPPNDRF
jgi:hypothetical protein